MESASNALAVPNTITSESNSISQKNKSYKTCHQSRDRTPHRHLKHSIVHFRQLVCHLVIFLLLTNWAPGFRELLLYILISHLACFLFWGNNYSGPTNNQSFLYETASADLPFGRVFSLPVRVCKGRRGGYEGIWRLPQLSLLVGYRQAWHPLIVRF